MIAIAGGVSANSGSALIIERTCRKKSDGRYKPKMAYCTDNAAMIADYTGYYKFLKKRICRDRYYPFGEGILSDIFIRLYF